MAVELADQAEAHAAEYMRVSLGFVDAQVTRRSGDGGIDVRSSRAVAQVKLHLRRTGRPDLQKLHGANAAHGDRTMLFFAHAGFSAPAVTYAESCGMALFTFELDGRCTPANAIAVNLVQRASAEIRRMRAEREKAAAEQERNARTASARVHLQREEAEQERLRRSSARDESQRRIWAEVEKRRRVTKRQQKPSARADRRARTSERGERIRRSAIVPKTFYFTAFGVCVVLASICVLLLVSAAFTDDVGARIVLAVFGLLGVTAFVSLGLWCWRRICRLRPQTEPPEESSAVVMPCPACGVKNRAQSGKSVRCGSCGEPFEVSSGS